MSLEVIAGCMYSGKTEELLRRLRRAKIAGLDVQAFKSSLDDRYSPNQLASHEGETFDAIPITSAAELKSRLRLSAQVIGVDEVQFLSSTSMSDPSLVGILDRLSREGVRVIVAGLDLDYLGAPFGPMPQLLALAQEVTKLSAICVSKTENGRPCGKPASRSYRIPSLDEGKTIQVGSTGVYEARCLTHWKP